MVADHRRALAALGPVAAGRVDAAGDRRAVGLRAGQDVVHVRRVAAAVDDSPFSVSAVSLLRLLAPCSSATLLATTTPLALRHGPGPMRSRALTAAAPPRGLRAQVGTPGAVARAGRGGERLVQSGRRRRGRRGRRPCPSRCSSHEEAHVVLRRRPSSSRRRPASDGAAAATTRRRAGGPSDESRIGVPFRRSGGGARDEARGAAARLVESRQAASSGVAPVCATRAAAAQQRAVRCCRHASRRRPARSLAGRGALLPRRRRRRRRDRALRPLALPARLRRASRDAAPSGGTSTGALAGRRRARWGFQITFFRAATGVGRAQPSRFAARQLLFAHAARHRPRGAPPAPRPAHRAQRLRHRRGRASATPTSCCATGACARAAAAAQPLSRARRAATAPASPSTSRSRRRSRCCCKATAALAQGPAARADEPLLQRAAARGRAARCASTADRAPVAGRAWLDHEWSDAYLEPEARRLGLDRHEPRRRRRADGLPHARAPTAARSGPAAAFAPPAARRATSPTGEVASRPAGAGPARPRRRRYPVEWHDRRRRPAASACARCSTTRSSTAAPAPARSTGKAWRAARRERRARRPRLPRDDRLRGAARALTIDVAARPLSARRPASTAHVASAGCRRQTSRAAATKTPRRQEEQVVRRRACRPAGRPCG